MVKIDCQKYADEILEEVKQIPNKKTLVILTAGDDPASAAYMRGKMKDCERCGVPVKQIRVESQEELLTYINYCNWKDDVGGIIVQLPLPDGFDAEQSIRTIRSKKDVDGFRADSPFIGCTPEGILYVLEKEVGNLAGKTVLLIGKGKLVGRPLIDLLLDKGCTLTIAHSRTKNLEDEINSPHDVIITAVGKPGLVNLANACAPLVIDAGISRDENGKLCGDCYNHENGYCGTKITTIPGGIGLMTRAMLMKHMGEVSKDG